MKEVDFHCSQSATAVPLCGTVQHLQLSNRRMTGLLLDIPPVNEIKINKYTFAVYFLFCL